MGGVGGSIDRFTPVARATDCKPVYDNVCALDKINESNWVSEFFFFFFFLFLPGRQLSAVNTSDSSLYFSWDDRFSFWEGQGGGFKLPTSCLVETIRIPLSSDHS